MGFDDIIIIIVLFFIALWVSRKLISLFFEIVYRAFCYIFLGQRKVVERDKNNRRHRVYHQVGSVQSGKETIYYENGRKNLVRYWRKGVLHGRSSTYYENSRLYLRFRYKNGEKLGRYTIYNTLGFPSKSYKYRPVDAVKD